MFSRLVARAASKFHEQDSLAELIGEYRAAKRIALKLATSWLQQLHRSTCGQAPSNRKRQMQIIRMSSRTRRLYSTCRPQTCSTIDPTRKTPGRMTVCISIAAASQSIRGRRNLGQGNGECKRIELSTVCELPINTHAW